MKDLGKLGKKIGIPVESHSYLLGSSQHAVITNAEFSNSFNDWIKLMLVQVKAESGGYRWRRNKAKQSRTFEINEETMKPF